MSDPLLYLGDHKRCSKCGKYKDMATEYGKDRHAPRGIQSVCKECRNVSRRIYRDREDWFWKRFWERAIRVGACVEWEGAYTGSGKHLPCGYWAGKSGNLRRIVWRLRFGSIPDGMTVVMSCSNRRCVSQYHMKLTTYATVEADRCNNVPSGDQHYTHLCPERVARGDRSSMRLHPESHVRGEQHPNAKLNNNKVREIRERIARGESRRVTAQSLGISYQALCAVLAGRTWKHVQ